MSDFIAKAWDKVKGEDDAAYASASADLKAELQNRADGVTRKGVTTLEAAGGDREPSVYDKFEAEFKRLSTSKPKAEVKEAASVPATTKPAPEEGEPAEQDLNKLTRAELDKIATDEFGFNPSDYSNKAEIVAAIEKARK